MTSSSPLSPKDFTTSQEVRWCPGCGDYAILKAVTNVLSNVGATREETVFISGIGCASRFPYYIESYGFHTIHGRAPAVATGVKLANPNLDVWVVTGDGDGLSIGGNHLLHALRRNVNLNILLFNNEIYGLTKGQYSPTSRIGTHSPSSPNGSIDSPISVGAFALGSGAKFFARGIDTDRKSLIPTLEEAHAHQGAALVEIYQNCIVYNEDVFKSFTDRSVTQDTQLHLEHGQPMLFGADKNRGIAFNAEKMQLENIDASAFPDQVLMHDTTNIVLAQLLIRMSQPDFPVALGVIYKEEAETFDEAWYRNRENGLERTASVSHILRETETWQVY